MKLPSACIRPALLAVVACSLAASERLEAGAQDPALARALISGKSLKTVVVTAEEAAVRDGVRVVATVGKGRMFGVIGREDGRVRVRACPGSDVRPGWIETRHVRFLTDDDIDLAGEALRIAGALNPKADVAACRARLDALVVRLAAAAGADGTSRERVRRVGRRLFGEEGFAYRKGVKRLDQVLARKEGDCVGLSLIYLAVARRLRMPLHLVTWPSHVLVRYDDGPDRFNIETTAKGLVRSVDDPVQHRRGRVVGGIHCMALPHPRALGVLYHVWGSILSGRGRHAEACERFARAAEINPRDAEAHALWGAALHKLGKYQQACERYADVVAIDPNHGEANIRWGFSLCRLGEYAEARAKYQRAVALAPEFADAWYGWGFALAKLGEHAEACERFAKAVELRPGFATAYAAWGAALARLGRYEDADRKYAEAVGRAPRSAKAYAGWGYTLAQMGRHADACSRYAEAVGLDPKSAQLWNNWGWSLARLGRYADACEKCARAVELDPRRAASRHSYGVALAGLGKLKEACAQFARAIELDPRHALSHADWAATLARMGHRADALAKLDKALKLDPSLKPKVEAIRSELRNSN